MKEEYWEQFMTTGRIADYLSYKAESGSSESRCLEEQKEQAGVRSGESDCFDRDGAVRSAGGGIRQESRPPYKRTWKDFSVC